MTCWKRISRPRGDRTTTCWCNQHGLIWTTIGSRERYGWSPAEECIQHAWVSPHMLTAPLRFMRARFCSTRVALLGT
jgi:hypothetical protein